LPESEIGGIILTSFYGKIVCSNTLKARLDYAVQQALPEVRKTLFTTELSSNSTNLQARKPNQLQTVHERNNGAIQNQAGQPVQQATLV